MREQIQFLGNVARRMAVVAVIAALLLPALLTILPSPASAEEQALYRDVMVSRCLEKGDGQLPMPGMSHGDCCLPGDPVSIAARTDDGGTPIIFMPVRSLLSQASIWERNASLPDPGHWLPLSRRGPPA